LHGDERRLFDMIPGLPQVGGAELIILLCIILLFFGAKRIPGLAKSLGTGVREFRKGAFEQHQEVEQKEKRLPEKEKADPGPDEISRPCATNANFA
jgi:sec-independent protein translocase protein TatA